MYFATRTTLLIKLNCFIVESGRGRKFWHLVRLAANVFIRVSTGLVANALKKPLDYYFY